MSINLEELLKSLNKEKLNDTIKKGNLDDALKSVDKEKAEKMINDLGLSEQARNLDLGKILGEVKKNPEILEKLKNLF